MNNHNVLVWAVAFCESLGWNHKEIAVKLG
jgi:hypothetical protein